jgi:hypothetical protein
VAVGHVNSVDWLLDRWDFQAYCCRTAIYDLAWKPSDGRAFQYIARSRDLGHTGSRWNFPRALFILRSHRLHLLQSVLFALETCLCAAVLVIDIPRLLAILSLHGSLEFFVGLLDSSKQCQGQPALWGHPWFGHGHSHLRLGSNRLHRLPLSHPLVGCGQHGLQYCIFLLVPPSHSLCETTLFCSFRVSCLSEYRFFAVHQRLVQRLPSLGILRHFR